MLHPRLAFWLFTTASLAVAAVALAGGALRTLFGLGVALALAWVARGLRAVQAGEPDACDPRLPRRAITAGVATALLGAAWTLGGVGLAGGLVLLFGLGLVAEGVQLSLEVEPVPADLPLPSTRGARLAAAVAADEVLRFTWDLGERVSPSGEPHAIAARLRLAAERNRSEGWLDAPAGAHPRPPALEKPQVRATELRGAGPVEHLTFESEFEPFDSEARAAYLAVSANREAHVWLFRAPEPRPTLVCVHGYGGGRPTLESRLFEVARLRERLGIDVALFVLPLHGARARGRRSGAGFLDTDPLWTNAAMGQAVWDLRRLAGWLRSEGAPVVGATGMSLGGYTTALWASLDERLACAVPVIPAVRLSGISWRAYAPARRRALEAAGASETLFDDAWATHGPLRHRLAVAPERALVIGGLADRICPPAAVRELWEHWDRPALHWFPGSHVGPVGRAGARTALESHLRATLCAPPTADEAPRALSRFRFSG